MRCFAALAGAVAICAAGLTMASVAEATTFTQMIGDNDGYGVGIPDNGDAGIFATLLATPNTDNRSAAEAAATNGAQFTDVYPALNSIYGPNTSDAGSFVFSPFSGTVTSATLTIDMAGLQSAIAPFNWGAFSVDINGVSLPFSFNDGLSTSVVRSFVLDAAQLAAINATGFLSLNIDRNGSQDYIGFDYVSLAAQETPLPAAFPLFATGLGALGLLGWRRRKKAAARAA